jgi:hypothetical protein
MSTRPLLPRPSHVARKTGLPSRRVADWWAGRTSPRAADLEVIIRAYPWMRDDIGIILELLHERYAARHVGTTDPSGA